MFFFLFFFSFMATKGTQTLQKLSANLNQIQTDAVRSGQPFLCHEQRHFDASSNGCLSNSQDKPMKETGNNRHLLNNLIR